MSVDLPGHGRSSWAAPYTFADQAVAIAEVVPDDRDLVLLGHSMGGVVALELADGSTPVPTAVVAFGVKVHWPEEHVAAAARMAARPATHVASRAAAVDRYLKLAGLTGLRNPGSMPSSIHTTARTTPPWQTTMTSPACSLPSTTAASARTRSTPRVREQCPR